jgi:hypothetical protein
MVALVMTSIKAKKINLNKFMEFGFKNCRLFFLFMKNKNTWFSQIKGYTPGVVVKEC